MDVIITVVEIGYYNWIQCEINLLHCLTNIRTVTHYPDTLNNYPDTLNLLFRHTVSHYSDTLYLTIPTHCISLSRHTVSHHPDTLSNYPDTLYLTIPTHCPTIPTHYPEADCPTLSPGNHIYGGNKPRRLVRNLRATWAAAARCGQGECGDNLGWLEWVWWPLLVPGVRGVTIVGTCGERGDHCWCLWWVWWLLLVHVVSEVTWRVSGVSVMNMRASVVPYVVTVVHIRQWRL